MVPSPLFSRRFRTALTPALGLSCVLSAGLLVGCDEQAAQRSAAARTLTSAIAVMQQADAAVPQEKDQGSYTQARLDVLKDAVAPLTEVATQGSPAQQAEARKLLAGIDAQNAEHTARQAADAFASLRVRMTSLLGTLNTVDTLGTTALFADRDPAGAIAHLQEASNKLLTEQQTLAGKTTQLQGTAAELDAKIAKQQQLAKAAFAEKAELDSAAFVQVGDEKFATLSTAAKALARANAADTQARALEIKRDRVRDELALANTQSEMTASAIDQFADTTQRFEESGLEAKAAVRTLKKDQQAGADALVEQVEALAAEFTARVQQPMANAADRAAAAVDHLQKAQGPGVAADLMDKQLTLAQTLTNAADYAGSMQASIDAIARRATFADAPQLAQRLADAAGPMKAAADDAKQAATDAIQTAQQSLGEPDPEDALATTVAAALTRLANQVAPAPASSSAPDAG